MITPMKAEIDRISVFEWLRVRVAESEITTRSGALSVTVSIGVACATNESTVNAMIEAADTTLYQAKHEGRNCIVYDRQCISERDQSR